MITKWSYFYYCCPENKYSHPANWTCRSSDYGSAAVSRLKIPFSPTIFEKEHGCTSVDRGLVKMTFYFLGHDGFTSYNPSRIMFWQHLLSLMQLITTGPRINSFLHLFQKYNSVVFPYHFLYLLCEEMKHLWSYADYFGFQGPHCKSLLGAFFFICIPNSKKTKGDAKM